MNIEFIPCGEHNYVTSWNQEEEPNLTRGEAGEGAKGSEGDGCRTGEKTAQERKQAERRCGGWKQGPYGKLLTVH